jgi:hypothetical protein
MKSLKENLLDVFYQAIDEKGDNDGVVVKLRAILVGYYPETRDIVSNPSIHRSTFRASQKAVDSAAPKRQAVNMAELFVEQKKSSLTNITPSVAVELQKLEPNNLVSEVDEATEGVAKSANTDELLDEVKNLEPQAIIERLGRKGMESLSVKLGYNISNKKPDLAYAVLLKKKLEEATA